MKSELLFISLVLLQDVTAVELNHNAFDQSGSNCSSGLTMELEIIARYFEEQHFLSILDLTDDNSLNALGCVGGNMFRPLSIFKNWESLKFEPKVVNNSVSSLPTTHGYFIRCSKVDVLNHFLERIAQYNPQTKLMFQITEQSFENAEEILKVGFEKYKLLNVAVMVIKDQAIEGHVEKRVSLCMFNPFSGNGDLRTPQFHRIHFSPFSFLNQLNEIKYFMMMRIDNLHKYPLKIYIFQFPMVSSPVYDDDKKIIKYDYIDGAITEILSEHLNFTPIYINRSDDGFTFGNIYPNGTFTGSLAALEYEKVDFVANSRLISNYKTNKAVFLQAIMVSKYRFIIQKRVKRRYMMLFPASQYDTPTWVIAMSLSAILPFIFHFVKIVEAKILNKTKHLSFTDSYLHVVALHYNISVKHSKFSSARILAITIVFYALIATSIFTGTIIKNMNTSQTIGTIKTIQELLDLNYKLVITHTLTAILKEQSGNQLREKLGSIARTNSGVGTNEGLELLLGNKDVAFLWSDLYTGNYLNRFYDEISGDNKLEIIPQTAFEFYTASMAPKTSPFIEKFNEIILRFVEAGLRHYHTGLAILDNDKIWYHRLRRGLTPKPMSKSLSLQDLMSLFQFFLGSAFVSVITFMIEILTPCLKKIRKKFRSH